MQGSPQGGHFAIDRSRGDFGSPVMDEALDDTLVNAIESRVRQKRNSQQVLHLPLVEIQRARLAVGFRRLNESLRERLKGWHLSAILQPRLALGEPGAMGGFQFLRRAHVSLFGVNPEKYTFTYESIFPVGHQPLGTIGHLLFAFVDHVQRLPRRRRR
jgi:hypothetical protein